MEKEHAEHILRSMIRTMALMDESISRMKSWMSDDEYFAYKSKVAQIMGYICTDILPDIYQKYPNLEPHDPEAWRNAGELDLPNWLGASNETDSIT